MTSEFHEQDLTGARFERVTLSGASFNRVKLDGASLRWILGDLSPWHPLDLPWDEAPEWDGFPWDRAARPALDEVLPIRRERQAMVRRVMESLTEEQLASEVSCPEPGWPQADSFPFRNCLRIILNEEWEHRLYAERDLTILEKEGAGQAPVPEEQG
ncbi:DinB family protein [Nonomuraea fuscirosea]|uniref:DinB family protein n=1 Tax=Nonomuraea fuscirosea TaxID=1291556 RepID=UPI003487390B